MARANYTVPGFDGPFSTIKLTQQGKDKFTVQYGKQVCKGLTYGRAASELGGAIMHALACNDKLDNRERWER